MSDKYQAELDNVFKNQRKLPNSVVSNKFKGLRVMGLIGDFSACGYYRIINPLHMLERMGATVLYTPSCDYSKINNYDYFIIPRQHSNYAESFVKSCHWQNKPTIFELDDNLEKVEQHNPAYFYYHKGTIALENMSKIINNCWGMTCSTKDLAMWYKAHNSNIAFIDNYIDFSARDWNTKVDWEDGECKITAGPDRRPEEWKGKKVIGWSGGTSHTEDLNLIGPAIRRILKERDDVIFVMYSSEPMYEGFCERNNIDKTRVYKIQARHFTRHPEALHGMDIQLAPVTNTFFNDAKTSLKLKEAMASGAIPIASCAPPYARFHKETNGLVDLVSSSCSFAHDSWYDAIMSNLESDTLEERKAACKQYIIDHHALEKNVHRWPAAWQYIETRVKSDLILGEKAPEPSYYRSKIDDNDPDPILENVTYKDGYYGAYGFKNEKQNLQVLK